MQLYIIVIVIIIITIMSFFEALTMKGSVKENTLYLVTVFLVASIIFDFIIPKLKEGFNPDTRIDQPCPEGSVKHRNGDCRMKGEGEAP